MEPAFNAAAGYQDRKGNNHGDNDDAPLTRSANNSHACREPGACRAGQAMNSALVLAAKDDPGAEKADAGQDSPE